MHRLGVLTINGGSSTIKFALFDAGDAPTDSAGAGLGLDCRR
jgi:acetate kinase